MQQSFWEDDDDDLEYRRSLLKAAANGDIRAQQELEREYHARVHRINSRYKEQSSEDEGGTPKAPE